MTPLDVSDGIAKYLMNELRKLNENSDVTERPIRVWSGFLPRVDKNEDKRKLCPAVVVHPYSVSDADISTVGITVLVTTYDEALTEGHVGLYHLLEVVRERLLSDNPVALKYEIKENTINTTIPDDQPYPQWVGYLEFEVYIPVIRRNLNKIFAYNKAMNPVVYVGPSFRSSRLNQFMVFSDGAPLPEAEDPIFMHLFVPLDKLNQAMIDVKTQGTQLNVFYVNALKNYKGVK